MTTYMDGNQQRRQFISQAMERLKLGGTGETLNKTSQPGNDDSDRMVIAIDFGTTYSGVAYAFSAKPDEVHCVEQWPGTAKKVPKAPTVLKYSNRKDFKWGYDLDHTAEEKIVGIKLLLDPEQKRPLFDTAGAEATKAEITKLNKAPVDIASDYIAAMYKHALNVIYTRHNKAYLDMLDKYFVLSVPAVWSDEAKDSTQRAARNAGVFPLELIKEPEAAAMYTLNYLKHQGMEVGDAITICDAGGGTVDLVSYEIASIHPLELKELVPPTGGIAGSLQLNRRFEDWVKNMVGERTYLDLKVTDSYRRAMKDFDVNIKPSFTGKNDETHYVNFNMAKIKDNPSKGIKSNALTLTPKDMRSMFQPVFDEIDRLVTEQVNEVRLKRMSAGHPKGSSIKAIFLVGGFGESLYLRESLAAKHEHLGIQVIQPPNAWAAIVRGAALSKLPNTVAVVSSVAERHYGIRSQNPWDPKEDSDQPKSWDNHEGLYRVDKMKWFINKYDDLERDRAIEHPYYRTWDPNMTDEDYLIYNTLWMCDEDTAPKYPTEDVKRNCKLRVDLSGIPKDQFKTMEGPNGKYKELKYKLLVKIEGARMVFSFECAGKEYASVQADFGTNGLVSE